jgi:SAM-dependent methyltransferase
MKTPTTHLVRHHASLQRYRLEPLSPADEARWDELVMSSNSHTVFHRRAWLDYLAESRAITTRLWSISDGDSTVGYFCGGTLKKGPFRILGSPLTGWGTNTLGPVFSTEAHHPAFVAALDSVAHAERLATIEVESTVLSEGALEAAGFEPTGAWTYLVALDASDGVSAWERLTGPCRNRIRRALKAGLSVEDTDDPAFVERYYEQYASVMRRKGIRPHYPVEYPRSLFNHLKKANCVLALQVKTPAGRVVASGLFPYDDKTLYFWGAASLHDSLDDCPNELLHWTAMQLATQKGLTTYNMSGHGRFKRKFGGTLTLVKRWHKHYWRSAGWARRGYRLWLDFQMRPPLRIAGETPETESRQADEFIDVMKDARRNLSRSPSYPLSDLWRAPLHHFPIRDEIIHQCLPLRKDMDVLEIGPGSGFTAFRVGRRVRHLSLLDVAPGNIAHLERVLQPATNLRFICADICRPGLAASLGRQFDVVYAIEVLEFVPDPAIALQNMASLLRRGGNLVLQFPNYPPPKNPGVTYFPTREMLNRMMRDAGFEVWTVHSLKLRRYPQVLVNTFLERPLAFYRRFKPRAPSRQPLAYDETWAFQNRESVDQYKYMLHTAWGLLSGAMRLGGPCFERRLLGEHIVNSNLLVLAQR